MQAPEQHPTIPSKIFNFKKYSQIVNHSPDKYNYKLSFQILSPNTEISLAIKYILIKQ
jgi:hypothetical protein